MRFVQALRRRWSLVGAMTLVLLVGVGAQVAPVTQTDATFKDSTAAQMMVQSTRWATSICVIWSNEPRADIVFTIASNAPLGRQGWTNIVDKTAATSTTQLQGCNVVMIAGEAWGVNAASRTLAMSWFNAGGSVLSTGNDSGHPVYPLPELIASTGNSVANYPYGGSVPASAGARSSVVPAFPSWTPGAPSTYTLDASSSPVTAVAAGSTCVGTVAGNAGWCAAIAKTNGNGGRWVHLHTKIGSLQQPGEVPGADAALAWLAIGRS